MLTAGFGAELARSRKEVEAMMMPQQVVVPHGVVDASVGGAPRWPRRPLGTVAFRGARWLVVLAALAYGPTHPLGHLSGEMADAMKLV